MSRLYDTVEPSPIDEEMLMQAVAEQGPKETAGRIAKAEGYDFRDVRFLRLDFKSKKCVCAYYFITCIVWSTNCTMRKEFNPI